MPNNDLISRAAAIDAIVSLTAFTNEDDIKKFVEEKACDDYFLGGICDAIDEIKNIAAVDAAPVVHGRWITNDDCGELECPICGGIQIEHGMFCTWCGARMDGGDNNA